MNQSFQDISYRFTSLKQAGQEIIEEVEATVPDLLEHPDDSCSMYARPENSPYSRQIKICGMNLFVDTYIHPKHVLQPDRSSSNLREWQWSGRLRWSVITKDHNDFHEISLDHLITIWYNIDEEIWYAESIDGSFSTDIDFDSIPTDDIRISVQTSWETALGTILGVVQSEYPTELGLKLR